MNNVQGKRRIKNKKPSIDIVMPIKSKSMKNSKKRKETNEKKSFSEFIMSLT